jgi:hypothetical protein
MAAGSPRRTQQSHIPIGIEKILVRAAGDPGFQALLLTDREAALEASGYELSASELGILCAISDERLATMIERIDLKRHGGRRFMKGVVKAALVAAGTAAVACLPMCGGVEPDPVPYEDVVEVDDSKDGDGGDGGDEGIQQTLDVEQE